MFRRALHKNRIYKSLLSSGLDSLSFWGKRAACCKCLSCLKQRLAGHHVLGADFRELDALQEEVGERLFGKRRNSWSIWLPDDRLSKLTLIAGMQTVNGYKMM